MPVRNLGIQADPLLIRRMLSTISSPFLKQGLVMKAYIKAGIIGGVIIFLWGVVSWMALPWHMKTLHSFSDQKAVADVVLANSPQSGMYLLPMMEYGHESQIQKPFLFASIIPDGMPQSMVIEMIIGLVFQIVAAILVAWMLTKVVGLNYIKRLGFVMVFALAAGIITHGMYWNWYGFTLDYTLIAFADLLIGWFLAGLVLAKMCRS